MAEEGQASGQEGGGFLAAMGEASMGLEAAAGNLVSGIATVLPAFPAARFTDLSLNIMHGHPHPPTFGTPLPSIGPVLSIPIFSTASTVLINGLTAARAGDMGIGAWCGGYFPMFEVFTGSSNVYIENSRASRMIIDFTKHCIFTSRPSPPPSDPPVGNFMGNLITGSPNVQIGGAPIPSLFSIFLGAAFAGLGKLAGKGFRAVASVARKAGKRLGKNMKPGIIKCAILKAEPVNVVTGEVLVEQQDFALAGRIPLEWNRRYSSQNQRRGVCGYGWETPADSRLTFEDDGIVYFYDGTPGAAVFPSLPANGPTLELVDGAILDQTSDALTVQTKAGLIYRFPKRSGQQKELLAESISDLSGNTIHFVRDRDRLREIHDGSGRRIEVISQNGLIQQLLLHHPTEAQSCVLVRYDYNEWDELTTVFDPLGAPYRFFYSNHRMVQHTDRNGLSFYYQYDQLGIDGRCVRAFGDNGLYDYKFEYSAGLSRFTDSLGHTWTIECDPDSFPIKETDPLGGVTFYEYDEVGRTTGVVDPDGNRMEYAYDDRGNLLRLTRPDGKAIIAEFDAANNPMRITDPNGATWEQEWNSKRLLTRQVSPLEAESRYEYDNHDQLILFINPRGGRTAFARDAHGNVTHLTDALGYTTQFAYDVLGNVTTKVDPLAQVTRYSYDPKGRLTQVMRASGATIACSYDAEDNLTAYQNENGAITRLEYCGLGEIKRRLQPDGQVIEYQYDTEERLIGVINQRGERYELKRDPLGRILEEIDYWGQGRHYTYTAAGHLQQSIDPLGRVIRYQTDPLGRILKKLLPNFAHPNAIQEETFAYDANGNLIACENDAIRVERQLDADGRLLQERQGEDCVVVNTYDPNGNRVSRTTSVRIAGQTCATTVRFSHDALDQVTAVEIDGQEPIRIGRNGLGQVTQEQLGSHLQRRFIYNSDGYLTAQHVLNDVRPVFDQSYRYDAAGNLVEKRDSAYGTERLTYDPVGTLIEHLDPQQQLKRHLADPAGDRLRTRVVQRVDDKSPDEQWSREGKYEGTFYRFNRAGNLIQRSGPTDDTHLTWDANQRLIASRRNDQFTTYQYDPLGRRVAKRNDRSLIRFYWDGDALMKDVLFPEDESKGVTPRRLREWIYYPRTFKPLAMLQGEIAPDGRQSKAQRSAFFYCNEPNGCPSRLLEPGGNVAWLSQYGAWGEVERLHVNRVDNPIRLQGQYWDEELELCYNRNRYYDPIIGCFVTQDPIGLEGGIGLHQFAPNATGWIDPLGLSCEGTAIISKGPPDPANPFGHFTIEVEHGGKKLPTHQVTNSDRSKTWIVRVDPDDAEGLTPGARLVLPDAESAMAYQRSLLGAETGPYSGRTNSCVDHVCNVLRKGGVPVPEGALKQYKFLKELGFF
jgi:RHS repeat-associated protein